MAKNSRSEWNPGSALSSAAQHPQPEAEAPGRGRKELGHRGTEQPRGKSLEQSQEPRPAKAVGEAQW